MVMLRPETFLAMVSPGSLQFVGGGRLHSLPEENEKEEEEGGVGFNLFPHHMIQL